MEITMHEIEPFFQWRDYYIASNDKLSPFYRRKYSEMEFTHTIYNYVIHPQWDEIDSETLYCKVLFVDYDKTFAVIEFIGEWNDAIGNDIMLLRKELIDPMMEAGINKFVLIGENVLNFHASDDSYYEDWYDEIKEDGGWIIALNFRPHVIEEMMRHRIHYYINMGENYNNINWRKVKPFYFHKMAEDLIFKYLE
jgi:hypothetical protein